MNPTLTSAFAKLAGQIASEAGGSLVGEPIVKVNVDGERVKFVFDAMVLFSAQSGSDTYEHHVRGGTAKLTGGQLRDVAIAAQIVQSVTEHEYEWAKTGYDRRSPVEKLARQVGVS